MGKTSEYVTQILLGWVLMGGLVILVMLMMGVHKPSPTDIAIAEVGHHIETWYKHAEADEELTVTLGPETFNVGDTITVERPEGCACIQTRSLSPARSATLGAYKY